jgi:hypothetical protein
MDDRLEASEGIQWAGDWENKFGLRGRSEFVNAKLSLQMRVFPPSTSGAGGYQRRVAASAAHSLEDHS